MDTVNPSANTPVAAVAPAPISAPNYDQIEQARKEEKAKLYSQLEHDRKQLEEARKVAEEARAEVARMQAAEKKRQLEALPQEEQTRARIADMESRMAEMQKASAEALQQHQLQARAIALVAYKERALRACADNGISLIQALVGGNSEQEIDASIEVARAEYNRIVQLELARRPPPQHPVPVAIPPNPAYPVAQPGGLPTPMAGVIPYSAGGVGVMQPQAAVPARQALNEQGVRSGMYSGELREQILAQARNAMSQGAAPQQQVYPNSFQPQIPHPLPIPSVQMPGGIQQPVGAPMMQRQHAPAPQQSYMPQAFLNPMPQMPQPQQYAPQPQQQQFVPQQQYAPQQYPQPQQPYAPQGVSPEVLMAQQAVARTLAGQNPLVGAPENTVGTLSAATALSDAQQYGQQHGVTADAAFNARFQPSPTIPS